MTTLPVSDLTQSIVELLIEAYDGPPTADSPTWFNDNDPNAGIFGQIAPLTADQVSKSVDGSGEAGTTIASHIEHLRWSLANVNATLHGQEYKSNWRESWTVLTVDANEWIRLVQRLRMELDEVCKAIQEQQTLPGEYLNGLIGLVPHTAYHLGVVRQMIERVKKGGS
ncbi:MAG: hypothetical protein BGO78_10420 [Chloroflexi bacterium 44-23]|nr:MAG: hypothetical protein BGO78_10420 [Chloroflexi bacterium 44-23]